MTNVPRPVRKIPQLDESHRFCNSTRTTIKNCEEKYALLNQQNEVWRDRWTPWKNTERLSTKKWKFCKSHETRRHIRDQCWQCRVSWMNEITEPEGRKRKRSRVVCRHTRHPMAEIVQDDVIFWTKRPKWDTNSSAGLAFSEWYEEHRKVSQESHTIRWS